MLKVERLLMLGFWVVLTLGMVSCSDDDHPEDLIGSWQGVDAQIVEKENGEVIWEDAYPCDNEFVVFNDDGTFISYMRNNGTLNLDSEGTWKCKDGKLFIYDEEGGDVADIKSLTSKTLVLDFSEKSMEEGVKYEYHEVYVYRKVKLEE